MRRRGFTLIELLIAVAIIVALVGLLLPALAILRKQQRTAATRQLMTQVGQAVVQYLDAHARFGPATADGGDAATSPWRYLAREPAALGQIPFLDLPISRLARADGAPVAMAMEADAIRDAFGDPLGWTIDNDPDVGALRWTYSEAITLRSHTGNQDPADDLVLRLTRASGRWEWIAP